MIGAASTVVAVAEHISSELGGEAVILNLKDGVYYGLDEVGVIVWRTIRQPSTVQAICDAVCAEYDVAPDVCERDVVNLLTHLREVGLVEVSDAAVA